MKLLKTTLFVTQGIFMRRIPVCFAVFTQRAACKILSLKGELEKMLPLWKNITVSVVFIQGGKDNLVPKKKFAFCPKSTYRNSNQRVFYPEYNHFIPFTHMDIVEKAILQLD